MVNRRTLLLTVFLTAVIIPIFAQSGQVTVSQWKGFERQDFKFQQKEARIVFPNRALPGNPWIWRARFPDWHTEADSILVAEGFHLVHINTADQYGSPKAMETWDAFYTMLTSQYRLHQKVSLAGVSRGGLFVYNWAKRNPDKVSCIYAEAPVCDFKSWPMGMHGKRSDSDWEKLKQAYGFENDQQAQTYIGNPIDSLEVLAQAKIPILHMIGLQDRVVPPEENTYALVNRYIKLGGVATVVPCTEGKQALEGHHFDIETPRYVADFIKYHTVDHLPLDAANYHWHGAGLEKSQRQFEQNKKGRIAFLGGSITYNGGWRDSVMAYFQERFPKTAFEFIAAGISSMGSTPSAFRLERDVLSKGPIHLLFVEAAVNDDTNGRTTKEQIRGMEGIIRQLRQLNPLAEVVMMHFVDPGKMKIYRAGGEPQVITNHNLVAQHYQIPIINLAKEVTERIDHGEFTWEDDFKDLHPSPYGQGVYAHSMIRFLKDAYAKDVSSSIQSSQDPLPPKIDPWCYDNGQLIDISTIKPAKGWTLNPNWSPTDDTGTRQNYTHVPMLISKTPGATLRHKFTGNAVGIAVAAGQDAGVIEYRIDKGKWEKQNLFTRWSNQLHLPWYYTLATGLSAEKHQLEIRIGQDKDPQSNGHACRIRYIFVNEY